MYTRLELLAHTLKIVKPSVKRLTGAPAGAYIIFMNTNKRNHRTPRLIEETWQITTRNQLYGKTDDDTSSERVLGRVDENVESQLQTLNSLLANSFALPVSLSAEDEVEKQKREDSGSPYEVTGVYSS